MKKLNCKKNNLSKIFTSLIPDNTTKTFKALIFLACRTNIEL